MDVPGSKTLQERLLAMFDPIEWVLFVFSLCCVSIIAARGEILDPVKEYILKIVPTGIDYWIATFIYCPMCLGFWIGFISSITLGIRFVIKHDIIINGFLTGCCVSVIAIGLDKLIWGRANGYFGTGRGDPFNR